MSDVDELARMEIRNFIDEGLKDVENNDLYDFDTTFDAIEAEILLMKSYRKGSNLREKNYNHTKRWRIEWCSCV